MTKSWHETRRLHNLEIKPWYPSWQADALPVENYTTYLYNVWVSQIKSNHIKNDCIHSNWLNWIIFWACCLVTINEFKSWKCLGKMFQVCFAFWILEQSRWFSQMNFSFSSRRVRQAESGLTWIHKRGSKTTKFIKTPLT